MKWFLFLVVWAVPGFCWGAVRSWTDVEGRVIQATPIDKSEGEVRIRRADGLVFSISLDRLSVADREWVAGWTPEEVPAASVEEAVVLIRTPRASGSGFLANFPEGVFLVTNQHVIEGVSREEIRVTDLRGRQFDLQRLEVSPTQDLARIAVSAPSGLHLRHAVAHDAEVIAYGNSHGGGVATASRGKVVGIAQDVVEVTAEIVQGNSGGPVVDAEGFVIGVASFVTREREDAEDWVTKGTRYGEARRFAIRLHGEQVWRRVDWAAYAAETRRMSDAETLLEQAVELATAILTDPTSPLIAKNEYPEAIQEIVQSHNQHVRRFESNIGRSVSGFAAIKRANQSQNANFRARLRRVQEVLRAEETALRAGRPDPSTPYLRERLDKFRESVAAINEGLDKMMEVERTFYILR